ncbi:hypothetical protein [Pseudoxanthomonas kaohsiungensis]|uniref:hypothetical protein n=1 Tax=Pseudoxanthomonas kaohsiungensis TaxID=283923 RepID=UPI0035B24513
MLIADELQFLTQGQGNILPAKLLNQLGRLGPPLLFVANYILIHRLNKRPAEEKQRLLTKPHFLHPDAQGSQDWRSFINALLRIAPELSQLDADTCQKLLHTYTFGLRRLVVALLSQAYLLMRKRKANFVSIDDIEKAYLSFGYATSRSDVELLIAGLPRKERRPDLWCPLPGADPPHASGNSISPHPATDEFVRRRDEAALGASLTLTERDALHLAGGGNPKSTAEPRPPRPKPTTTSLLEGAARFRRQPSGREKP